MRVEKPGASTEATAQTLVLNACRPSPTRFAADVLKGLSRQPRSLPSKHFYDQTGSELFRQITETEEYYLTRCETEILHSACDEIRRWMGDGPFRLVELGAGDGRKTGILLEHFLGCGLDFRFVPMDICPEAVDGLLRSLMRKYAASDLRVCGLVGDYFDGLQWLRRQADMPSLVLFLGSSIGNFTRRQTRRFLARLRASLRSGDHVLVGFDLKKDIELMQRAYNDAAGLTERFNLNLLTRINRELGGEFDLRRFRHYGHYHAGLDRMESWLVSTVPQRVHISRLRRRFCFRAWEGIHVENSCKYDIDQIAEAAAEAGFAVRQHWFDSRRYFVDSLWQVQSERLGAARAPGR